MLRVESMFSYPLTGGYRQEHNETYLFLGGIPLDRALLLYQTGENGFERIGQKRHSQLATVKTRFGGYEDKSWYIDLPFDEGTETVKVSVNDASDEVIAIDEFGDKTECHDMGDETSNSISRFLGKAVRLAQKTSNWVNGYSGPEMAHRKVAPLHIVSLATVRELQHRIPGADITPHRFRPTLILESDGEPFEEMEWIGHNLMLGSAKVHVERETLRCLVTGYDQETGMNMKDVPKLFPSLPHMVVGGEDKAVIGVYAYPTRESVLKVGQEGGIWD